jgi:hypothetical protein
MFGVLSHFIGPFFLVLWNFVIGQIYDTELDAEDGVLLYFGAKYLGS